MSNSNCPAPPAITSSPVKPSCAPSSSANTRRPAPGHTQPDQSPARHRNGQRAQGSGDAIVSSLLRQLPWTHNLLIMAQGRSAEERAFYLRLAIRERWGTRKLERQLRTRLFERSIATPPKVSAVLTLLHPAAEAA